MTQDSSTELRTQMLAFARGDVPMSDLGLEDEDFWLSCVLWSARPGRSSSRAPNLRTAAERLLNRPLTGRPRQARRAGLIHALSRPDPRVRRAAIRALRESNLDDETVEAVGRATRDSDNDVRVTATTLLARQDSPRAAAALADLLANTNDVRATIASEALSRMGKPAIAGLTRLLDSPSDDVRWRATICLSQMADMAALPGLIRAFHDDSPSVAWVAADGLLELGPDAAEDVLRSVLSKPLDFVTIRALHHYAEHATPRAVFRSVFKETGGLGAGSSTAPAVQEALAALSARKTGAT